MKHTSAALVLVLLAVAGCGGSDSSFTADYNEAVRPVLEFQLQAGSSPRVFDRLARRSRTASRNLARVDVPDDLKDDVARVRARLSRVAAGFESVATARREQNPELERRAIASLKRSTREFQQAENALSRAVQG